MASNDQEKQNRIDNYENKRLAMLNEGYTENICTISIVKANIMALVTTSPIIVLCIAIYFSKWDMINFNFNIIKSLLFVIFTIACIVIHEIIHGLTWSMFCKNKWESIHLGIMLEVLTPYCHCKEPLKFGAYILGGLMPLLVLGIGVFIFSLFIGSGLLLFLSLINILGAGGDVTIAIMLLRYKKALILDHPTKCGFVAFTV